MFNDDGRQMAGFVNDDADEARLRGRWPTWSSRGMRRAARSCSHWARRGPKIFSSRASWPWTIGAPRPSCRPWKRPASTSAWRRSRSSRRATRPSRRSGPMASPSSTAATTPRRRWSSSPSSATEGQRLRVEVTGEPPLSAAAAEEYGWAEQGNAEAPRAIPAGDRPRRLRHLRAGLLGRRLAAGGCLQPDRRG